MHINYQMIQTLWDMTDNQIEELLSKFKEDINYSGPIYTINRCIKGKNRNYCELNLCSPIMCKALSDIGCI